MSAMSPSAPSAPDVPPIPPSGPVRDRGTVRHGELRASRWSLRGIAKVTGSAQADIADLDGTVVVGGGLTARRLDVRGRLEVRGPVVVPERLSLNGTLVAGSSVSTASARLRGSTTVVGRLEAVRSLATDGNLQAAHLSTGTCRLRGRATIPGELQAMEVEATFLADTSLGEVRCRSARLRGPLPNPVRWALGRSTTVEVRSVEAESVYLEGVRVEFVRAPEIVLGPASHLLAHEGSIVRAHASSRVGPESWSRPPDGLRR